MHGTSSTSSSYDEALSNATSNVTLIKPLMIEDLHSVLKKTRSNKCFSSYWRSYMKIKEIKIQKVEYIQGSKMCYLLAKLPPCRVTYY